MELRDRINNYLDAHTTFSLATAGPTGPWATPVLYVHDGTKLYFTSVAKTRHASDMLATGQVAASITGECTEFIAMKGVQLEGHVELVADLDERRRIVEAYLRRFPFSVGLWHGESDPDVIARDPGVHDFYRITPTRLVFTDYEYLPGGRAELKGD
jgi:uncharacterized protein YhbP (UPF0306 family)